MYELKAQGHSKLSEKVIKYVQKSFGHALLQNKGDQEGLSKALSAIVPHMYGDHKGCNESWCGYKRSPSTYNHTGVPHGRDLTCGKTRSALSTLFQHNIMNASKLLSIGSSQVNKSTNNIVRSKQPKSRSYASSSSFEFRVGAALSLRRMWAIPTSLMCIIRLACHPASTVMTTPRVWIVRGSEVLLESHPLSSRGDSWPSRRGASQSRHDVR